MAKRMRVVVAEEYAIVRTALVCLLGKHEWIEVIGEAAGEDEALALVQRLKPDLVILDLMTPEPKGVKVIQDLRRLDLPLRIIVLTAGNDDNVMIAAYNAGADGYLRKTAPPEELVAMIRAAYNNQSLMHPSIAHKFICKLQHTMRVSSLMARLSNRERQILIFVATGLSDTDIAHQLDVHTRTIRNHIIHILSKLELGSRTAIALFALRNGLVRLEDIKIKRSFRPNRVRKEPKISLSEEHQTTEKV